MWCASIFVVLISVGTVCNAKNNFRVKTEFGFHQGTWAETHRGERVASYLGIPYAKPPIGDLRFKKPEPWTTEWRRLRDSTKYPPPCLPYGGPTRGSEDCLYLNIYTPELDQPTFREENVTNRAVLVFLLNGLLRNYDSSYYSPEYLLDQDIVLVTVNYRYGFLGFFTTGDEAAPGNYGLKDVLEALRWIQRNIEAFGGDPDNVTLMGHSTGAGIAHLLALSDKSEGLFHKYVTQSGAGQAIWSFSPLEKAKAASLEFASIMPCNQTTSQEIVECMRHVYPAERDGPASYRMINTWESWCPTNEIESEEAVITEHPKTLMKNKKFRDIPWLTGVVADEGLPLALEAGFAQNSTMCEILAENFEEIVFDLANYRRNIVDPSRYVTDLAAFYFGGNLTVDCAESFAEMVGDLLINWPVYETVTNQASKMKSGVYLYKFAYNGTFTASWEFDESDRYGICHGDEMNYLFPVLNNRFHELLQKNTENDETMINILTEMWANFAKTGVPSARFSPEWESYQVGKGYMEFGPKAEISMQKNFLHDRMVFWQNLTEKQFRINPLAEEDRDPGAATSVHVFKNFLVLLAMLLIPVILVR